MKWRDLCPLLPAIAGASLVFLWTPWEAEVPRPSAPADPGYATGRWTIPLPAALLDEESVRWPEAMVMPDPPTAQLMRRQRELWDLLSRAPAEQGLLVAKDLAIAIKAACSWALETDPDLREERLPEWIPRTGTLADQARAIEAALGAFLVPDEGWTSGRITRTPSVVGWPGTWRRSRILLRLEGGPPDATEACWRALGKVPAVWPDSEIDLDGLVSWLSRECGVPVGIEDCAAAQAARTRRLRVPPKRDADSVGWVARGAVSAAGLGIAARSGEIRITTREEADIAWVRWQNSLPCTDDEWEAGARQLASEDDRLVKTLRGHFYPAEVGLMIRREFGGTVVFDDLTWDGGKRIWLEGGPVRLRDLRGMLLKRAGSDVALLRGEIYVYRAPAR